MEKEGAKYNTNPTPGMHTRALSVHFPKLFQRRNLTNHFSKETFTKNSMEVMKTLYATRISGGEKKSRIYMEHMLCALL